MIDLIALVDIHGDDLFRFALSRVGDRSAAEDLVQDTFLAAHQARSSFEGKSSEKTWLLGILKHKVMDYYRSQMRGMAAQIDPLADPDTEFSPQGHWNEVPKKWNPDAALDEKEFLVVLRRCLSNLPLLQRQAFMLREIDGFESEEICKKCEISTTNLWVLLHRARMKLRSCLEKSWFARS